MIVRLSEDESRRLLSAGCVARLGCILGGGPYLRRSTTVLRYYVDWQCIDCEVCRANAPANFMRSDNGYSFVHKQPETEAEWQFCEDALAPCPVEAIGNDA